ncbi:hypothetical protein KJ682_04795 [bacterium]|nr:hypothetical protein [bacterium]
MLQELRIGNLALVEETSLTLGPGLTMLTGETGAGKSLIAGSLGLLAGGKPAADLIRTGEELGYVEGLFDLGEDPSTLAALRELGIRVADDRLLVLRRELRREGRSRVLINGLVSSLALLEEVGPLVLSIQSQDQQRVLARPHFAGDFLDGLIEAGSLLDAVARARGGFRALEEELAARRGEADLAREQLEMWEYQARELREAGLDPDEEGELTERIHFGRNARKLLDAAAGAGRLLADSEPSVSQLLGEALGLVQGVAGQSQKLARVLELLRDAEAAVGEAGSELEHYLDAVEIDPRRLDELEERKALYEDLQRKYRRDVPGLIVLLESLEARLARQKSADSDLEELAARFESGRQALADSAKSLRDLRRRKARAVAARAVEILRPLALPHLELEFEIAPDRDPGGPVVISGHRCRVTDRGADVVKLLVRTNPGEGFGEVHRIASGGERSRIYLGLSVLEGGRGVPPLRLFDEIDAGLGLEGAMPVARLLESLARAGQVVCITHLPTVAARGARHLTVTKEVKDGRTTLRIRQVEGEERLMEIARLLGGKEGGEGSSRLAYARELLAAGLENRGEG